MTDPKLSRVAKDFLKLRALLDQPETSLSDLQRLQTTVSIAERDHDWTVHSAMTLLETGLDSGVITYNLISILRTIERRARRARLAILNFSPEIDEFQAEYWRTVVFQDIEEEVVNDLPHWDSEVEEQISKDRHRHSTLERLGTSSTRLQKWIRDGDKETRECKR